MLEIVNLISKRSHGQFPSRDSDSTARSNVDSIYLSGPIPLHLQRGMKYC
jgi:hypothetical protein